MAVVISTIAQKSNILMAVLKLYLHPLFMTFLFPSRLVIY